MASASEELGNATILGGSINPLQVYIGQQAARERQQAEKDKLAIKDRDKLIDDLDKHSPDKVWDPFYGEINQITNSHVRDYTRQAIDAGMPIPRIQQELNKRWGDVNTEVSRANMHKESYHGAKDQLKQYGDLYKPEAHTALNNVFFDGPNAKKIHDINVDNIAPQVFDNPDLMNKKAVAIKFMKDLPEKVNQYYTDMFNPLGQQYNIQDTKTKLGIQTKPNPITGQPEIIMDPNTGMPKINMTDDVYIQAIQDPMLQKIVAKEVPNGNIAQNKAYLTALLEGYDPKELKNRPQLGFKTPESDRRYYIFGNGGYGYKNTEADLKGRDELLDRVVSGSSGKDILSYFGKLANDIRADYAAKDDKGNKGKFIKLDYISGMPQTDAEGNQTFNIFGGSKSKGSVYLPINTEEEKRTAKVALSQRMDEINKKTALGEEYPTYINEKRKTSQKNKPAGSSLNATQWKNKM